MPKKKMEELTNSIAQRILAKVMVIRDSLPVMKKKRPVLKSTKMTKKTVAKKTAKKVKPAKTKPVKKGKAKVAPKRKK